jgi:hypothetical protein
MKYLIFVMTFMAIPANAITWNQFWRPFENGAYYRSPVYYAPRPVCTRVIYREEYIPGNEWRHGYVRTWTERVHVPCGYY